MLQSWHRGPSSHRKVVSLNISAEDILTFTSWLLHLPGPSDLLGSRHVQSISSGLGQEALPDLTDHLIYMPTSETSHIQIFCVFPITQKLKSKNIVFSIKSGKVFCLDIPHFETTVSRKTDLIYKLILLLC